MGGTCSGWSRYKEVQVRISVCVPSLSSSWLLLRHAFHIRLQLQLSSMHSSNTRELPGCQEQIGTVMVFSFVESVATGISVSPVCRLWWRPGLWRVRGKFERPSKALSGLLMWYLELRTHGFWSARAERSVVSNESSAPSKWNLLFTGTVSDH